MTPEAQSVVTKTFQNATRFMTGSFSSVQNTLFLKLITRKSRKHHLTEKERELVVWHVAIRRNVCTVPDNVVPCTLGYNMQTKICECLKPGLTLLVSHLLYLGLSLFLLPAAQ